MYNTVQCTPVHWTNQFLQGTRKTRPCLTGYPVPDEGRVSLGVVLEDELVEGVPDLLLIRRHHPQPPTPDHLRQGVYINPINIHSIPLPPPDLKKKLG